MYPSTPTTELSFGPSPQDTQGLPGDDQARVEEMAGAHLEGGQIAKLQEDFFPELAGRDAMPAPRLVRGIIFDFDFTLAHLTGSMDRLMEEGARNAEAYMRGTGMDLLEGFHVNIVEARRFAAKKSEDEQEEHIADDAMSFLLQFFGYPASKMKPEVLRMAVDLFYAPEMTAWRLDPGAETVLTELKRAGYRLALLANHPCDRVFQRTVDFCGIRHHLELCLSSASVEYRKPDVRFFQLALERWDLLPYEVVVVGDSLVHDIAGGLELGALTVQVETDGSPQIGYDNRRVAEQIKPDALIQNLADLMPLVQAWAAG